MGGEGGGGEFRYMNTLKPGITINVADVGDIGESGLKSVVKIGDGFWPM